MSVTEVKECARCVLSTAVVDHLTFSEQGLCQYCLGYDKLMAGLNSFKHENPNYIDDRVKELKAAGKGNKYDCILGVSGGVDSSYVAYWVHKQGLRPLVVHLDNGWNSEIAVSNIEQLCQNLGFDLHTHVIDWDEFKALQLAYLKAGVIDIEALTDHAIMATIRKMAAKYKIKYTFSGFNYVTEAIMPKGWTYDKTDFINIRDIAQKYGRKIRFKTYPHLTFLDNLKMILTRNFESIRVLNYLEYDRNEAKEILTKELGWKDYGGKHYESVFTKFYQAYILPKKFGVDKRYCHQANMICSGQTTKAQALSILKRPIYEEEALLREERDYVLKKLGLSDVEFEQIMQAKPRKHQEFKTVESKWELYFKTLNMLKFFRS